MSKKSLIVNANLKKRILIYQNGTSGGGSKRSLWEIVRLLREGENELMIVCSNSGWFSKQLENNSIEYEYFPGLESLILINKVFFVSHPLKALGYLLKALPRLPRLWNLFRNSNPDLMVINEGPRELLEFLPFLFFRKSKLVVISQIETELTSVLSRFICSRADKIFVASNAVKEHFLKHRYEDNKIAVIPLIVSVNDNASSTKLPNIRAELKLAEDTILIGNISAIHPRKGLEDLIKAFALIAEKNSQAHLIHVGGLARSCIQEQKYHEVLKLLIAQTHLEGRFHFLDWREDLQQWLAQLNVVIMPTRREGLCRAAVECLWAGVPIVAYNIPSMQEVVNSSITGYLVPFGKITELGNKTLEILDNPQIGSLMRRKSKELWLSKYKPDICRTITKKAFEELWEKG